MELYFQPVTKDRWGDFERLFESRGGPHYCWCMAWRRYDKKQMSSDKVGKKMAMKGFIDEEIPVGLLAYANGEPIGWCSVAPRDTYRSLSGDDTKTDVWSIVCFFIKRKYRDMGLWRRMLDAAIEHARESGAKFVEAYPVDPDSPSYRYMGVTPMFEEAGFEFVKAAGKRRNVMLLELT